MKLKAYIPRNLDRYGNCVVGGEYMKRVGKNNLINELKKQGYTVVLYEKHDDGSAKRKSVKNTYYVLERS